MAAANKSVRYHEPDQCLMHFRTDQGVKIQKLFETMAPLVVEANIVFNPKGITLNSLASMIFANFELKAENMDQYKCDREFVCGVNFPVLFKYFKTVTQNDAVAIQITQEGFNATNPVMFVHVITATMTYSYRYKLLALDEVPFEVPEKEFDTIVRISSVAFLRALRSCEQVGDTVQVMSRAFVDKDNKPQIAVYVVCEGLQSDLQVTISSVDEKPSKGEAPDVMNTSDKREKYNLKFMNYIAKATSLNSTVQLFLATQYAMMARYRVGKLGHVTFAIPPKLKESEITVHDIDGSTDAAVTTASKRKLPLYDDSHPLPEVLVKRMSKKGCRRPAKKRQQQQQQPKQQQTRVEAEVEEDCHQEDGGLREDDDQPGDEEDEGVVDVDDYQD